MTLRRAQAKRFRRVGNHYPRRVGEAYDWDLVAAGRDDDETMDARVGEWEPVQGLVPWDWRARGEAEHPA
jgi:hypothetical protein